ncbi:MAG TPA: hypothetical protein VNY82_07310 [Steroidobacteraceae bacterium]|nr:hypothetical protein [Steroidobacteraceae bacterium]
MPEAKPQRVAVRFPPYSTPRWRERVLASLAAAGQVEVTVISGATLPDQVDLVVDLSTGPIDPRQLVLPRLGYWTFIYGDEPERIEPGLQEFVAGGRAAYARLVRLDRPDHATVLKEGAVKAVGHSLDATRERLLEAIVDWPGQLLKETLQRRQTEGMPTVQLRQRGTVGHLFLRARLPTAWIRNILVRALQEITREHWTVGVIAAPIQQVCQSFDPATIRWLEAPPDGFLADPFGLARVDGTLVILAEALSWQNGLGRIVAFELRPDGTQTSPRDVFAFTSHASYPQLIEHEGAIYCIPETLAQGRVQLFRADPFPNRWVPDSVLLENFPGADATVRFHDSRWWLFVGNHADQDEAKLFVFHAADLRGPWLPHAANPVKCDLRSARPAGPLFMMDGVLYRPAQDCSVTYGGAVVINKIERLTPEEFVERPVRRLAPAAQGPYPHGLHTLSDAGSVTLVDGKRHVLSAALVALRLRRFSQRVTRTAGGVHDAT